MGSSWREKTHQPVVGGAEKGGRKEKSILQWTNLLSRGLWQPAHFLRAVYISSWTHGEDWGAQTVKWVFSPCQTGNDGMESFGMSHLIVPGAVYQTLSGVICCVNHRALPQDSWHVRRPGWTLAELESLCPCLCVCVCVCVCVSGGALGSGDYSNSSFFNSQRLRLSSYMVKLGSLDGDMVRCLGMFEMHGYALLMLFFVFV